MTEFFDSDGKGFDTKELGWALERRRRKLDIKKTVLATELGPDNREGNAQAISLFERAGVGLTAEQLQLLLAPLQCGSFGDLVNDISLPAPQAAASEEAKPTIAASIRPQRRPRGRREFASFDSEPQGPSAPRLERKAYLHDFGVKAQTVPMAMGEVLRDFRTESGLSVRDVAATEGIKLFPDALGRFEEGHPSQISRQKIIAIAGRVVPDEALDPSMRRAVKQVGLRSGDYAAADMAKRFKMEIVLSKVKVKMGLSQEQVTAEFNAAFPKATSQMAK